MDTCTEPGAFADWEFEAALDDTASPAFLAHVAICASCAERLQELRQEMSALNRLLSPNHQPPADEREHCPTSETLLAYRWGGLDAAQQTEVISHLRTCTFCTDEVGQFLGAMTSSLQLLSSPLSAALPEDGLLARVGRRLAVIAAELFTPATEMLPAVRGDLNATGSTLLNYRIAERGWELVLMPSAQPTQLAQPSSQPSAQPIEYLLSGQLLGPHGDELSATSVTVLDEGRFVQEMSVDGSGWFDLPNLPSGHYSLWLEMPEVRIEVKNIKVGIAA